MANHAYLRVSTQAQTTDNQQSKIGKVFVVDEGCWHVEHAVSGKMRALDRPVFKALSESLQPEDSVIVVSLDRLGRDTEDVLHTVRVFKERGIHLRVMDLDGVDLTSQTGKILVVLMSLVAELERDKCISRTEAALERARDEGKIFGRSLKVPYEVLEKVIAHRKLGGTWEECSTLYKYDKNTLCQLVKKWNESMAEYQDLWNKQQIQKKEKEKKLAEKALNKVA